MNMICVDNNGFEEDLEVGKIYWCKEEINRNDWVEVFIPKTNRKCNFVKERFEKINKELFTVECVEETVLSNRLMKGTDYEVYKENEASYLVVDETGEMTWFSKAHFKKIIDENNEVDETMEHYKTGEIEPFDFYHSNGDLEAFCKCCINKYTTRLGKKLGEEKKDIKKIIDYALTLAYSKDIEIDFEDLHKLLDYRKGWINDRKK
ncbi:MAG: DUF6501 family protein [Cetobacterium sp.]